MGDSPAGGSDLDGFAFGIGEIDEEGVGGFDDADVDRAGAGPGMDLGAKALDGLAYGVFVGELAVALAVAIGEPIGDVGGGEREGLSTGADWE